ncbi:MAG: polynucleotide adenylyltransferase PcnB [Leptospiraceae bacterium]|nr:polynucleotide adenylyltransferase PcnB [Leptospiraceae bacterium]
MLRKILHFLRLRRALSAEKILRYPEPKVYSKEEHGIHNGLIDPDALKVVRRIHRMGCEAYIVGGSIRDLLLGRKPKDFDVVSDAHPQELRRMFDNSRIIGRRFRLVHVVFRGNKIIEVSTARSLPQNRVRARSADELYLRRDNQYGSFKEDAARRDFTLNALAFDIRDETILDYTGGFEDIRNRVIRVIGDPHISFPEDPVRMYRAVKYAALLGFELESKTARAIEKHRRLLTKASPARMHEEYNKVFRTAQSAKIFAALNRARLLEVLMPTIIASEKLVPDLDEEGFLATGLGRRLAIADRMIQEHEDVNLTVYFALLIAGVLEKILQENPNDHEKALERKLFAPLQKLQKELALTRREFGQLLELFSVQNYFRREVRERKGWVRDFQQRKIFAEAFTVYKVRARASGDEDALQKALFWEIGLHQKLDAAIRRKPGEEVELDEEKDTTEAEQPMPKDAKPPKPRRRRHRRKKYDNATQEQAQPPAAESPQQ